MEKKYTSPHVEVIEINVEKGFACTGGETEQLHETPGTWGPSYTKDLWDNM